MTSPKTTSKTKVKGSGKKPTQSNAATFLSAFKNENTDALVQGKKSLLLELFLLLLLLLLLYPSYFQPTNSITLFFLLLSVSLLATTQYLLLLNELLENPALDTHEITFREFIHTNPSCEIIFNLWQKGLEVKRKD